MSTTIDQRVVEMRFDNKHFEQNVSTTMSTLEKLKQALHLPSASKSLEGLSTAAKSVNMNGLGSAVETVSAKFSALQVMGVTALANITNSAVNAGKNIAKALTIDPVKTGLSEYETKINAIQVIQANTRGKNTMDDITKSLDELNEYADKTIYNFAQMTSNIGKFTAQGFNVQDATNAVKGLANLAAASGASAEDMARATYQMSQALGSSIKLMDWNSLRNANMATQELKETLIALARTHGVAIDQMIEDEGTFEYTLQNGWLTGEMFTEAMNIYSGVYSEAELKAKGFTDAQIKNFMDLAKTAESAATEVKTFSQLFDVLKETAQSGWTQTWELFIGDFDAAKSTLTELQKYFSGILDGWSDARNTLLGGALDPKGTWEKITAKLDNSGLGKIKDIAKSVENVTDKLEHFQEVVNKVWRGDFGNSDTGRFELLEKAGYDHRVVQDLVNKGYDYKLTIEDIEASHKKFGLTLNTTKETTKGAADAFNSLSDEQLRNAGLTDAEIKLYRDLEAEAKRTGKSVSELIDEMSKKDGRTMLIESFKNAWQGLSTVLKSVKDAFVDIFPPMTVVQLYNLIKGLNEFSQHLVVSDETADKLQRTFKGLFALLDIVLTVLGGPLKWGFDTLVKLLEKFDLNILDITASAGDAIVKFRDWIDENNLFIKGLEIITPYLKSASDAFRDWIDKLKNSKNLPEDIAKGIINGLGKAIKFIKSVFSNIGDLVGAGFDKIPDGIITGLANGIMDGAKVVWDVIMILGKTLLEKICEVLGIHSPSTEFFEIGKNIVLGLFNGIKETVKMVYDLIMSVAGSIVKTFQDVDPGTLIAAGLSAGMIAGFLRIGKALQDFASPLEGVGDVIENAAKVVKSFSGVLKSFSMSIKAKALQSIAIALAILVGSVVVLSLISPGKLIGSIVALGVLAGVLVALSAAINKFGSGDAVDIAKFSFLLLSLSAALLIIAGAVKILETVDPDKAKVAFLGLAGVVAAIGLVIAAFAVASKFVDMTGVGKLGGMLLGLSISLIIMVGVIKLIGKLSEEEIKAGTGVLMRFVGMIAILSIISLICGKDTGTLGTALLKISAAIAILAIVVKMVGSLDKDVLAQGIDAIWSFVLIIAALTLITKIGGKQTAGLGTSLLGIAAAMAVMAIVVKLIAGMDDDELKKGVGVVLAFGLIIAGLIWATKLAGPNVKGLGATMLAMSIAIGILAGIAVLLSLVDVGALVKGTIAVAALAAIMSLMVASTKGATSCVGNLIVLTIAIAVLAASVATLSMIDTEKLAGATLALGVLIGMFAILVDVSGKANGAIGSLIVLTVAVGLIGGILYLLSGLPVESTLGAAAGLSLLIGVLSGVLLILDKIKTPPMTAIGALAVLSLVLLELGIILKLLDVMNIDVSVPLIAGLSVLLLALVGVMAVLTLIVAPPMGAIGALAVLSLILLELGAILKILEVMDINVSMETVTSLSVLLGSLTAILGVLTVIGLGGPAAYVGVGALATLIAGLGAVIVAIGALVDKFPMLETFLDKGIPVLEKIGYALGSFFGNIVGGFAAGATAGLPEIGSNLTAFMENANGFIEGAKSVDDQMMSGVKAIAETILILTAADILEGLTSWLTGGSSLADFGMQLGDLGTNLNTFVTNLGTFSEDQVNTVANACNALKTLAEAASVIPNEGGIWASIVGENSIGAFGAQLGGLGTNLNTFVTNLGTFSEDQVATVKSACDALTSLASAAETIPNEGGLWASIVGENSIGAFGAQLGGLGTNLNTFVTNLGTFSEDQVATVKSACDALKALAEAAGTIPNEGGLWASIVGENSIGAFGAQLGGLGTNLNTFVTNLGTFTADQVSTIACAGDAIKALANAATSVSGAEGFWDKIFGDNSLTSFSDKLPGLGTDLASFVSNLGTFSSAQVTTVGAAVDAINALASLADTDLKGAAKSMGDFGDKIVDLGSDISDFSGNINDGTAMTTAVDNLKKLVKATQEVIGVDAAAVADFGDALKKLGENGVKSFTEAFTDSKALSGVKEAAKKFIGKAVEGIEDKEDDVEDAAENAAEAGADAMDSSSIYEDYKGAGKYCVEGFAAGIKNNKSIATEAAKTVAAAALKAAKEKLKEHSPSKAFYEIGDYAGLGFVNALFDYESISYDAGSDMADSARNGLSYAISKIRDLIESDMDTQPTIRPVLDLTDLESRAGAIGDILGGQSVGMHVGAISSMMNRRNQNGANDEVVSAIDKLGKHIDNMPHETYNVNGITYNGEDEVADAIRTLARYAKVGRRV